jgi:hypothetical protein
MKMRLRVSTKKLCCKLFEGTIMTAWLWPVCWNVNRVTQVLWMEQRLKVFKRRHVETGQTMPLERNFGSHFSCGWDRQPTFKFDINLEVLFIYRLIPRNPGFLWSSAEFDSTPISRFFKAFCSSHGCILHKHAPFFVSFDIYALHCAACEI